MENRPEDMPKVVALSIAIIAVFSVFVWQRVHGGATAPTTETRQTGPLPTTPGQIQGSTEMVVPGQMRLLTDQALDGAGKGASHAPLRADAFRSLVEPEPTSATHIRPGPPVIGALPGPLGLFVGPIKAAFPGGLPHRAQPDYAVTLEGVLSVDQNMEAVCTVHDPKIADPERSDRTVFLHIGDIFGGRRIETIDASGLRLRGADWWQIGQERQIADATVITGLMPRTAVNRPKQTSIARHAPITDDTAAAQDAADPAAEDTEQPHNSLANH